MGRVDGKRVKKEIPMYFLIPQFMTERNDAMNMMTMDVPIEPLRNYMNEKRKQGYHISHMAILMSAYNHLVREYPALNRFIANRRIYDHKDFTVSLVVLRPGSTGNDDTFSKLTFVREDTVFDVQRKLDEYIEKNSSGEDGDSNSLDRVMGILSRLGFLLDFVGWLLRRLDRWGWLPRSLVDASPFHASLLITNLASIRTNHIYHHVYNFGTTSVGISMGNFRDVARRGKNGQAELVRCMPLGITMDERICSGHYMALAFVRLKELLAHPELLEQPGAEVPTIRPYGE